MFHMKKEYQDGKDDILLAANEGRQKDQMFTDISEWERAILRSYCENAVIAYRTWESTKELKDPTTGAVISVDFNLIDVPTNLKCSNGHTKERPVVRVLPIGDKMAEWLRRSMGFEKGAVKFFHKKYPKFEIRSFEAQSQSVPEFIEIYLDNLFMQQRITSDISAFELEERSFKKTPQPV